MSRATRIGDVRTWLKLVKRRTDKERRGSGFVEKVDEGLPTLLRGSARDTRCAPTIVMPRAGVFVRALRPPEVAQEGDRVF